MTDTFTFGDIPLVYNVKDNDFVLTENYTTPELTVPMGVNTDGASVPRILQNVFPRYDKYLPACIVHDYMYGSGLYTKKQADDLFKKNLKRLGLSAWFWWPMYWSVRLFGASHYTAKREEVLR